MADEVGGNKTTAIAPKKYNNQTKAAAPQTKPGTVAPENNPTKPTAPPTEPQTESGTVAPENYNNQTKPAAPPTEPTEEFETKTGTVAPKPTGVETWVKEGFNPNEWFNSDVKPEAEKFIASFIATLLQAQKRLAEEAEKEYQALSNFLKDLDNLLYEIQSITLENVETIYDSISLENWQSAFIEVKELNKIADVIALDKLTSMFGELYVVLLALDTTDAINRGDKERFDKNIEKLKNQFKDTIETKAWKDVFKLLIDNWKQPPSSSAPAVSFKDVLTSIKSFFEGLGRFFKEFGHFILSVCLLIVGIGVLYFMGPGAAMQFFERATVKQYGGFITTNHPFIAREAGPELVGTLNGRTAVANNSQIVTAVSRGVSSAFLEAFYNQEDLVNVEVFLDGRQLETAGCA